MGIEYTELTTPKSIGIDTSRWLRKETVERVALVAIVALAVAVRFSNLSALGYANHYYAAAVKSMMQSWHNFFFAAAEPGGAVSVDKPPIGLWFETISALIFGVNGFGLLLPELLAGVLSVILVYRMVRQSFGAAAGLLAGLALSITPVVVATDRNNTMDSTLILTLLLAAWAFVKATRTTQFRYLLLGGLLVGIAFNIKMLQAYLPLPAFYALYLLGSSERLWRKAGKLAITTVLLLAVSLSWAVVVDATPASQRPFVGSSGDNSVMSLIVGYNGLERLVGMRGPGGFLGGIFASRTAQQPAFGPGAGGGVQPRGPNATRPQSGVNLQSMLNGILGLGGQQGPGFGGFGGGLGGPFNTGRPGLLRLFIPPLSNEMSWLLPLGLFGALLVTFRHRLHWPLTEKHQAAVLWGGWLLSAGLFFSIAGFFHPYYLAILGAPTAALVGIAGSELWAIRNRRRWLGIFLLLVAAALTLWVQWTTAQAYVSVVWWMPIVAAFILVGVILMAAGAVSRALDEAAVVGFACIVGALVLTPGIWSALTTMNSSANQSLPGSYTGQWNGPGNRGGLQVDQALLNYLQANTKGVKYLFAVPSSMQGADYVLATGRPVLYLGGFSGQDRVVTADSLAKLVAQGQLRYIYTDARGRGFATRSDVSSWVTSHCTLVNGYDAATQNAGAPDGTGTPQQGAPFQGRGGMQVSLYQCGK